MAKSVVILGGGISGLALAWFLKRKHGNDIQLTLIEKERRLGGWIQTVEKEGFRFEQGPRSFRISQQALSTLQLIEELGLQEKVIVANPVADQRFLYLDSQLVALPKGMLSLAISPFLWTAVKGLWRDWCTPPIEQEDETVDSFISRRLGPEVAERFIDPLISGIYAGNSQDLSIRACFPQLWEWEQSQGCLWRGALRQKRISPKTPSAFVRHLLKQKLFSFKEGMETLPRAISAHLEADIWLAREAVALKNRPEGLEIHLSDGAVLMADHVYGTLPARAWPSLCQPLDSSLASEFKKIPYASVAVVNVSYSQKVLSKQGFGYLIPSKEGEKVLGVVWDSCVFPQQNTQGSETRLTVMIGGTRMRDFDRFSDEDFKQIALDALQRHLGISQQPEVSLVKRAYAAIPQYQLGHAKKIANIQRNLKITFPHLTLLGPLVQGASVHECITAASRLASPHIFHR
jgi:oxygen-dependent protoporphyrinogen oxidase